MKKILALFLVLGCIFAFASCNIISGVGSSGNQTQTGDGEEEQTLDTIQSIIGESAPRTADIDVTYTTDLGDLNGSYDVTYNDDGSATVEYSYELFNKFDENAVMDEPKSTYTGVVVVAADGEIVGNIGGVASVEAVSFDIELDEDYLDTYEISAGILTASVKSEDSFDVLGVDIPYDLSLAITTAKGHVTSIVISYEAENGSIEINAAYHY